MSSTIPSNIFFSVNDFIFGHPYKYWVEQWCKWFYGKRSEEDELQSEVVDGVYFLGTKLTVPNEHALFEAQDNADSNKPILVNCGKWTSIGLKYVHKDEDLIKLAKDRMDTLDEYSVSFNGVRVEPERCRSDVFRLNVNRFIDEHEDPVLGKVPKIVKGKYNAVIDGYWLFLKPVVDIKKCTINSFTTCKTGVLSLRVNHEIALK
jgi:hypothetical protein